MPRFLLLSVIAALAFAELGHGTAPRSFAPFAIDADGPTQSPVRVHLCDIQWDALASFQTYAQLVAHSGCTKGRSDPSRTSTMTLNELAMEFTKERGCNPRGSSAPGCTPAGLVYSEPSPAAGGIVFSQMIAASNSAIVYAESGLEETLIETLRKLRQSTHSAQLPDDVIALSILLAAFGRPVWAAAGAPAPTPRHFYIQIRGMFASGGPHLLSALRVALPTTPWVFSYLEPADGLHAALMDHAPASGRFRADPRRVANVSCAGASLGSSLFSRLLLGEPVAEVARMVTSYQQRQPFHDGLADPSVVDDIVSSLTAEAVCAVVLAERHVRVLAEAAQARTIALNHTAAAAAAMRSGGNAATDAPPCALQDMFDGRRAYAFASYSGISAAVEIEESSGALIGRGDGRGVVGGIGQGLLYKLNVETGPRDILAILRKHLAPTGQGPQGGAAASRSSAAPWINGAEAEAVLSAGRAAIRSLAPAVPIDKPWPALALASQKYLRSVRCAYAAFNARHPSHSNVDCDGGEEVEVPPQPTARPGSEGGVPPKLRFDVRMLPLGGGYPATYPLREILGAWNPDITSIPAHYGRFSSMRYFNGSDAVDMAEAELYRRAEVPFVVRNPPGIKHAVSNWGSDEYILQQKSTPYDVEINTNKHFMYYKREMVAKKGWVDDEGVADRPAPPHDGRQHKHDWDASAAVVEEAEREEEGDAVLSGEIPAGWMAAPAFQSADTHLSEYLWRAGGVEIGLPRDPLDSITSSSGSCNFPYGISLSERRANATSASPPPPASTRLMNRRNRTMYYAHLETNNAGRVDPEAWVIRDLPLFDKDAPPDNPGAEHGGYRLPTSASSFFLVDPRQSTGNVLCRWGQRGTNAEAHFDAIRNFVAILSGRKRYILAPPHQCEHLSLLRRGPANRHSSVVWTTPEGIATVGAGRGFEVVLEPGDVLYIPAFWMHFIVSLTTNSQCNTRSGTPPDVEALSAVKRCGFDMSTTVTEAEGVFSDLKNMPLHHTLATALGSVDTRASLYSARVPFEVLRDVEGQLTAALRMGPNMK